MTETPEDRIVRTEASWRAQDEWRRLIALALVLAGLALGGSEWFGL